MAAATSRATSVIPTSLGRMGLGSRLGRGVTSAR